MDTQTPATYVRTSFVIRGVRRGSLAVCMPLLPVCFRPPPPPPPLSSLTLRRRASSPLLVLLVLHPLERCLLQSLFLALRLSLSFVFGLPCCHAARQEVFELRASFPFSSERFDGFSAVKSRKNLSSFGKLSNRASTKDI